MHALRPTAVLFAALTACSSAPGRPATARRPPRTERTASAVHARSVVVPTLGPPRLLYREPGAASYYGIGGIRARVRGTDVVVAAQPFASSIVGAAQVRGGHWLFVTATGTVARAEDFVGPMRFVQSLGVPVVRAFSWEGGLVAVTADGTPRRVGGGPDAGAVPRAALESPDAAPRPAPDHESGPVASAALARFSLTRLALPSTALLTSSDVAVQGTGHVYFAAVASDGALVGRGRVALAGGAESADCALHAWGARALLACPDGDALAPYSVDPESVERLAQTPGARPMLVGREGRTLTFRGPCPDVPDRDGAPDADATHACTHDGDRGWREWTFPRRASVLGVFDARALLSESADGQGASLRVYNIDVAREVRAETSDPAAGIALAGFGPDGRIIVLAHSGVGSARQSLVAVSRPGELMRLQPLGFFARDVAMADARRGLAVGANAYDVAETTDGGVSWSRVEVAVDGEARRVSLELDAIAPSAQTRTRGQETIAPIGQWVQCSPLACRAAGRIVHLWGEGVDVVPAME